MTASFEVAHTALVSPQRLAGWLDRFAARHGECVATASPDALLLNAADGARARLLNRWEPLDPALAAAGFVDHVARHRRIALLLVRKGASAVGIAEGTELVVHRNATHYVQGRTKAGGWSQQRYARRRDNQTSKAYQDAADDAFEVLVPVLGTLTALVTGGDKVGLTAVLADPRLAGLAALPQRHPILPAPEARLRILAQVAELAYQVPIELDAIAVSAPGPAAAEEGQRGRPG